MWPSASARTWTDSAQTATSARNERLFMAGSGCPRTCVTDPELTAACSISPLRQKLCDPISRAQPSRWLSLYLTQSPVDFGGQMGPRMPAHESTDEGLMTMPDHLYKYRDFGKPEHLKSAILEHKFFFDSPNNFNDPFECLPSFTFDATEAEFIGYYKRIVARRFPSMPEHQQIVKALEYRLTEERERQPGSPEYKQFHSDRFRESVLPKLPMFCTSATNKNVLLWSHYAWNHTGICLQFDANSPDLVQAQCVMYRDTRPEVNFIVEPATEQVMENTVLVKAKDWEYEQEWRVISFGRPAGIRIFKPETLTGVIFGHKTSRAHKKMVREWLVEREAPVRLMQAVVSISTYEVDIYDC